MDETEPNDKVNDVVSKRVECYNGCERKKGYIEKKREKEKFRGCKVLKCIQEAEVS